MFSVFAFESSYHFLEDVQGVLTLSLQAESFVDFFSGLVMCLGCFKNTLKSQMLRPIVKP